MWRLFIWMVVLFIAAKNFDMIIQVAQEVTRDIATQFNTGTFIKTNVEKADFNQNLSQKYRQYKQGHEDQKFTQDISEQMLSHAFPGAAQLSQGAQQVVKGENTDLLSSPYGTHGNNYSLYDINSPSGQFFKP